MTISGSNPTSYFSTPSATLDPTLFEGRAIKSWVRTGVTSILTDFLSLKYRHSELWAHAWLAGSGVSYQWNADRQPGDLDCLIGINFVQFRKANPEFAGLLDKEIADQLNEEFRAELQGQTENWNGFELTFYALTTSDIRNIKPYAAYDLKYNEWTVSPDPSQKAPVNNDWDTAVNGDYQRAQQIHTRFSAALQEMSFSHAGPARRNAEVKLANIGSEGAALYEEIHGNRGEAFTSTGQGYGDFHNYRWQGGKRTGAVEMLRELKKYVEANDVAHQVSTYGFELPGADTLVRRAATYRNK